MKNRLTTALLAFLTNCIAINLLASATTFQFTGNLFQAAGPNGLTVGDPFTGSFSYTLEQQGVDVPLMVAGQETRYILDQYTLTIQGQTLSASQITSLQVVPEPTIPGLLGLAAVLFGFLFFGIHRE